MSMDKWMKSETEKLIRNLGFPEGVILKFCSLADDKITRSKLSEKDHRKDTEDEEVGANISGPKPKDTSKEKSKATTQAQNTKEEESTKKKLNKLQIGVGDTKGLERKTKSVRGKEIADSSGGEIKYASETQSETEMPVKTDDEFELVKAEAESFSDGDYVSLDLTKSDDSNRSVEEYTLKVHGSPVVLVKDYFKLAESGTSDVAGTVTPETGGVFNPETEDELKQSESGSSIYLDAHTTFEGLGKKSGFDLEINTNIEGLKEELYGVSRRAIKGKAKLEREGKESDDDDLEVETNIKGLAEAMRKLYRQVTKGTKGKLKRLMKNREEYSSEAEELELDRECEMLLKTPLRQMLELDTEIRGLVEELDVLLMLKEDDEAGPKLLALRDELEVLKESNYEKEVELIDMVKELIDDEAEALAIDAMVQSEVDPIVENAKERMARVKSEMKEVEEMDRNKSSDAAEN